MKHKLEAALNGKWSLQLHHALVLCLGVHLKLIQLKQNDEKGPTAKA